MASNFYIQHIVGGEEFTVRRSLKQGRKSLPSDLVRIPISALVLPVTKERIQRKAGELNMSLSAYIDLAVSLFDIEQFSCVENCSNPS